MLTDSADRVRYVCPATKRLRQRWAETVVLLENPRLDRGIDSTRRRDTPEEDVVNFAQCFEPRGGFVGSMVQADLDTLHKLGTILVGHADAIDRMKVTATVTMPASPVQTQCNQVDDAVHQAFRLISGNIREMSNATKNAAGTYEQADHEFAAQLRKYTNGS